MRLVENNTSCIADNACYEHGQLRDREILAGTNVKQLGCIAILYQETSCIGQIIDMKKFPTRGTASPKSHLRHPRNFGLMEPTDHSRNDVRGFQIEVVSRTVEVRRHEADRGESILGMICRRELDSGDLRDRISFICRFQGAGQQGLFFNWLGCQPRINTGGTEKQKSLHTVFPRGMNDIGLNCKVLVEKLGGAR